jgi:CRP-like cAMP-binding protein
MEIVRLERNQVLHRPGEEIVALYFPIDCLISITVTSCEGKTAEAGAVGRREVVGINAFMGGHETTQTQYITQIEGTAVRIPADPLKREFDSSKPVRDVLLRYTQVMIAHLSQNVACNRLHTLEQRFARWLLEIHDRIQSDAFHLTHEFMAEMLGVRRSGVTEALNRFEEARLIVKQRDTTRLLNVKSLAQVSCGCYAVVCSEYERLLGPAPGGEFVL